MFCISCYNYNKFSIDFVANGDHEHFFYHKHNKQLLCFELPAKLLGFNLKHLKYHVNCNGLSS